MAEARREKSRELREKGNALYKANKLEEAIESYREASKFAPDDPLPFSNLSAVLFECGSYELSIKAAVEKALPLLTDSPEYEARKQKLYSRMSKACLHCMMFGDGNGYVGDISPGAERDILMKSLEVSKLAWTKQPDEKAARRLILERIPKYKPQLQDVPQYFSVGHDFAASQFDEPLQKSKETSFSFMFCGVGDARHLLATIWGASTWSFGPVGKNKAHRHQYHITIMDHKAAVFARDLILFFLLEDLSLHRGNDKETLAALSFLYNAQIVPGFVYRLLQQTIKMVVDALEKPSQLPKWLFVPKQHHAAILEHLVAWQAKPEGKLSTKTIRGLTVGARMKAHFQAHAHGVSQPEDETPEGCAEEKDLFDHFGLLSPTTALMKKHDPDLLALLDELEEDTHNETLRKKLNEYLDKKWMPNVTIVDMQWQASRDDAGDPDMAFDPYVAARQLFYNTGVPDPQKAYGMIDYMSTFWGCMAAGLDILRDQLTVEVLMGEMNDVLERIRYDLLEQRKEAATTIKFPRAYDRIHMSNVPDYTGGPLTSTIHASPLLKHKEQSLFTCTVLRNTNRWKSIDHYNAEYALVATPNQWTRTFDSIYSLNSPSIEESWVFPLGGYHSWERGITPPIRPQFRINRAEMENWLYAMFLKLVLPYPRPTRDFSLVFAPLNLTAFLQVLAHVSEIGYPAHWLSGVVSDILENHITTTKRAPKCSPATAVDVGKAFPSRSIDVSPFTAEFSTLVTIWQRILPFGLIAPTLPGLQSIQEFSISFPSIIGQDFTVPHFCLVFWKTQNGIPPKNLRPLLLDDEKGDNSASAKQIRESGVVVCTTFTWCSETRTAKLWLRKDIIAAMKNGDEEETWEAYVWRTDTWERATKGVGFEKMRSLRNWI